MSDRTPGSLPAWSFGGADFKQPPFDWRPVLVFAVMLFVAALIFGN